MDEYDICSSHYLNRYEFFLDTMSIHGEQMGVAMEETKKYKCAMVGQEFLDFLYFYEMYPFIKDSAPANLKDGLEDILSECQAILVNELLNQG